MSSLLIPKKCQLCFLLSLKLNSFFRRFFGLGVICRCINRRTLDAESARVAEINAVAPDCVCEKSLMSAHSPGVVDTSEVLARFVFSPIQIDRKGKVKPNSFSHVHSKGCSIQRDSAVNDTEILALVENILRETQIKSKLLSAIPRD